MAKAKNKRKPSAIPRGVKASVMIERGAGRIVFENVPPAKAPALLAATVKELRRLSRECPELVPDLSPVGGYTPVEYTEDEWSDDGNRARRVGFTARR